MHERDAIFREQLVSLMAALNGGEASVPRLRRTVGAYALQLSEQAGAASWADLKERADGRTYDSMLKMFRAQSEEAAKAGDPMTVRALEVLALSLIARRQDQPHLVPGVAFLDDYIAACVERAKRRRANAAARPVTH